MKQPIKIITAGFIVLLICSNNFAITARERKDSLPYYRDILSIGNIYNESINPIKGSHATLSNVTDISVQYQLGRGDFHDIDEAPAQNRFDISIKGIQRFGKLDIHGKFVYQNSIERQKRWNSTLFVSEDNPFKLADSVAYTNSTNAAGRKIDMSTVFRSEKFYLTGGVSYRFSEKIEAGVDVDYKAGTIHNAADPRPRTEGMRLKVTPGVNYSPARKISIGAYGRIDILNEATEYNVMGIEPNRFILFKGVGHAKIISSSNEPYTSYDRDTKGMYYTAGLQFRYGDAESFTALLDAYYETGSEVNRDGGVEFDAHGGLNERSVIGGKLRFNIKRERAFHDISTGGKYHSTDGTWYDQTGSKDPLRDNHWYFTTKSVNIINDMKAICADMSYKVTLLKNNLPDLSFFFNGDYTNYTFNLYESSERWEEYSKLDLKVGASKYFNTDKVIFNVELSGKYGLPLSGDLEPEPNGLVEYYTKPAFEYKRSSYADCTLGLSVKIPVKKVMIETFGRCNILFHLGKSLYSDIYDKTHFALYTFGAGLLF